MLNVSFSFDAHAFIIVCNNQSVFSCTSKGRGGLGFINRTHCYVVVTSVLVLLLVALSL